MATRRSLSVEDVRDLGRLDAAAIAQVVSDAQPFVRNADELHDTLLSRILLPVDEGNEWSDWFTELADCGRATRVTFHPESAGPDARQAWTATERVPAVLAAFPNAVLTPMVHIPEGVRREWESTDARVAMVRGLLESCGPITTEAAAARIGITVSQTDAALESLEGEGILLRGKFSSRSFLPHTSHEHVSYDDAQNVAESTPHSQNPEDEASQVAVDPEEQFGKTPRLQVETEWCHRRLLSRIHRLTMDGLRRQIEPVSIEIFMKFLFRHHGILEPYRRTGSNGLFEVIGQLQGLDIPAVAWERDVLPLRVTGYESEWLDELCLTGEVGWSRLFPPPRNPDKSRPMASLTRVAPISIFLREDLPWLSARAPVTDIEGISSPAEQVLEILTSRGAMFGTDLQTETRMLRDHLDDALGELVSRGLITADGIAGLRALIAEKQPASRRSNRGRAERIRVTRAAIGRWSAARPLSGPGLNSISEDTSERPASGITTEWAWQLLRRWGIVFRDLLSAEDGAPTWFELLQIFRRLEARGEIRGGRFITGVAGEQFALADTVQKLRQIRDEGSRREIVVITAADPLNLVGILSRQERVPGTASNRVAYLDGLPVAALRGGTTEFLNEFPEDLHSSVLSQVQQCWILPRQHVSGLVTAGEQTL
ncbi:MAG: DEAD/DEAH box helicase, partial [Planctomycetaceae bacterium]|nr:DEAD/DEAH box helicase [Planctomycetaceae bacterium]